MLHALTSKEQAEAELKARFKLAAFVKKYYCKILGAGLLIFYVIKPEYGLWGIAILATIIFAILAISGVVLGIIKVIEAPKPGNRIKALLGLLLGLTVVGFFVYALLPDSFPISFPISWRTEHPSYKEAAGIAKKAFKAAHQSGIDSSVLLSAETAIFQKHGPDLVKPGVLRGLIPFSSNLAPDAIAWIQERSAIWEAQAPLHQQVIRGHVRDGHFVDLDGDGKADADDVVWNKDVAGHIVIHEVGKELAERLQIGAAIVNAAQLMAKARHRYAITRDCRFSVNYWVQTIPGKFRLKSDGTASAAVNDIFSNPREYQFGSGTATTIVQVKAILDLIGPDLFDKSAPKLSIGVGTNTPGLADFFDDKDGENGPADPAWRAEIKPGDEVYFLNPAPTSEALHSRGAAQHAVYLGDGKYYAHDQGITTEKAIIDYLNGHRDYGVQEASYLTRSKFWITSKVFKAEKQPDDEKKMGILEILSIIGLVFIGIVSVWHLIKQARGKK
jgi:protein-glutamine gamma-glutamyltransferase